MARTGRRLAITTKLLLCIPVLWVFAVILTFGFLVIQGSLSSEDLNMETFKKRWNEGRVNELNKPLEPQPPQPPQPRDTGNMHQEGQNNQNANINNRPNNVGQNNIQENNIGYRNNDNNYNQNIGGHNNNIGQNPAQQLNNNNDGKFLGAIRNNNNDHLNQQNNNVLNEAQNMGHFPNQEHQENIEKFENRDGIQHMKALHRIEEEKREKARLSMLREKEALERNMKNAPHDPAKGIAIEKEELNEVPKKNPEGPGEMGRAVVIDENQLSPIEKAKYKAGWGKYQFNEYVSNLISLHRSLPDQRPSDCLKIDYPKDLPDTSIIIVFRNEAWSTLLRTVYSCLERSPPELLKEIILVDDFSDFTNMKEPLDNFVASMDKVKLVRAKKREGLIRARLLGSAIAQGEVLTFLDSHCECTAGWLEPLMDTINKNKTTAVSCKLTSIDYRTLEYRGPGGQDSKFYHIGGFDWDLLFHWKQNGYIERVARDKLAIKTGLGQAQTIR